MSLPRRHFLQATAALGASLALPAYAATPARKDTRKTSPKEARKELRKAAQKNARFNLVPSVFSTQLDPHAFERTMVWGFNDHFPGPVLRYKRGELVHIHVNNQLPQDTAVHWHGLRVPNAMDGVPNVTQVPISPKGSFDYRFQVQDSGTYWYHPHQSSFEQVPRGLYGALIVEEDKPPKVDRDEVWVVSDIKLDERREQVEDFGRILDIANDGRLGNQWLVNGHVAGLDRKIEVRAGERMRLRFINAASARVFRIALERHEAMIIAYDGQGIEPQPLPTNGLILGPGMRVDLIIDCFGQPGERYAISDMAKPGSMPTLLGTIAYSNQPAVRAKPLADSIVLAPNAIAEPNLTKASDHFIMFQGGMRGSPVVGMVDGKPTRIQEIMAKQGLAWTMNFNAQHEHALMHEPLLHLQKGEHVMLHMINETDFAHPMHLHGHFFRVLSVNGVDNPLREWRDTVMMGPRQTIVVAFVADNPGEWMYHCHILDHAAGGMMGTIVVE